MHEVKKKYLGIGIIVAFILLATWFIYSYFTGGFVRSLFTGDLTTIENAISKNGITSMIIFGLLAVMECVFAPFPPLILYIAGGVVFGGFMGGLIATIGNTLGAFIDFEIARHYGRDWVKKRIPKHIMQKIDNFSKKYGSVSIFVLRINPLTSSDLFSYAAGLTKMDLKKFLFWTTVALAPTIFLQTYFGGKIQSSPLLGPVFLIGGSLYLIGFFIFYFWFRKKHGRKH
jgi:uncharacterized membrane protein YdjX (TVP38/TMEM64 family)